MRTNKLCDRYLLYKHVLRTLGEKRVYNGANYDGRDRSMLSGAGGEEARRSFDTTRVLYETAYSVKHSLGHSWQATSQNLVHKFTAPEISPQE
ncbi:hypothetical protein RvY_14999 [Ramazzottius varieornatus]|uniref:Uncharacterized protein n=1 Tax=Ramazzottius varieornatus TaxID=947166 RepID=A0A1D1VWY2_RAMVA|nr:hypothetical protein RvY_14999 [Ramazzottius varieornatus]